jgi:hypothetical protein
VNGVPRRGVAACHAGKFAGTGLSASAVYLEQRPDVEHYLEVMDQLSGEALTPADSIRFIEQVASET